MIKVGGYFEQIIWHNLSLFVLPYVVSVVEYNKYAVVVACERLQRLEYVFEIECFIPAPDVGDFGVDAFTRTLLFGFVPVFVVSRDDVLVSAGVFDYLPHSIFLVVNEGVDVSFDNVYNHFAVSMRASGVKDNVILLEKFDHELGEERPHLDAIYAWILLGLVDAARFAD